MERPVVITAGLFSQELKQDKIKSEKDKDAGKTFKLVTFKVILTDHPIFVL